MCSCGLETALRNQSRIGLKSSSPTRLPAIRDSMMVCLLVLRRWPSAKNRGVTWKSCCGLGPRHKEPLGEKANPPLALEYDLLMSRRCRRAG
jgi:hypothetical protein